MLDDGQLVRFRNVPQGSEFYYAQTLMVRLPEGVTENGKPRNAYVLDGRHRGSLTFIESHLQVSVPNKIIPFRRITL